MKLFWLRRLRSNSITPFSAQVMVDLDRPMQGTIFAASPMKPARLLAEPLRAELSGRRWAIPASGPQWVVTLGLGAGAPIGERLPAVEKKQTRLDKQIGSLSVSGAELEQLRKESKER